MFTGIIEDIGVVVYLKQDKSNLQIDCRSKIAAELRIDQSVSHNGVCLTVININTDEDTYSVIAVKETLEKTNLKDLQIGEEINLERSLELGERLDGHLVQGHVDQKGRCININKEKGSWIFTFEHDITDNITVEKGSVCINGVSLTVFNSKESSFSVAIIPHTFTNTNFKNINIGTEVNIEFDVIGKYISKIAFMNF